MAVRVVYESMFGTTQEVALAVVEGLRSAGAVDVEALEVGQAPPLAELRADLVVVGAPTHAFGLSRPSTRADAARRSQRPLVSQGDGVREWLDGARRAPAYAAAAFGTSTRTPSFPGKSAKAVGRRLSRLGCRLVVRPETFEVEGYEGLRPGERDRAVAWGAALAGALPQTAGARG